MKLVILDRDGVINHDSAEFIKIPEEWTPIPGSLEAIARLNRADYQVVVITNQSGIARGLLTVNALNRIHQKMFDALHEVGGEISAIFFCQHGPGDGCDCRKPRPGLFLELADRLKINLTGVPAVGDSLRDLEAARAAGASPVLVRTGKGEKSVAAIGSGEAARFVEVPVHADLAAFVDDLLGRQEAAA